jgi:hypothetical protein
MAVDNLLQKKKKNLTDNSLLFARNYSNKDTTRKNIFYMSLYFKHNYI